MTKQEIDDLVQKYAIKEGTESHDEDWMKFPPGTQYDDDSANVNYSLVRHFQPTRVLEFGTRTGRCTHDITLALLRNKIPFLFKPYELENDLRLVAQTAMNIYFGTNTITIGGDVTQAQDIPDKLDYVFIDNYHDLATTQWVFDKLLPKCTRGALIHFHDLRIREVDGKWVDDGGGFPDEPKLVIDNADYNGGALTKLFFYWEHGNKRESAWFTYNPK